MSTYIMSDIHGSSKRFYEMLKLIQIDWSKDYLYINGDIVDRGKDSLKLFYEILEMKKKHGDHIVKNVDDSINVIESIESALRRDEYEYLISGYLQYDAPAWITKGLEKVMCVGHVPTMYLPDIQAPVICMKSGGKVIMTDCGAGHPGGRLGCIRLEDEKLFYVE